MKHITDGIAGLTHGSMNVPSTVTRKIFLLQWWMLDTPKTMWKYIAEKDHRWHKGCTAGGWRDESAGKELATGVWGPWLHPWNPQEKTRFGSNMPSYFHCRPGRERWTSGAQWPASLNYMVSSSPVRGLVPPNKVDGSWGGCRSF